MRNAAVEIRETRLFADVVAHGAANALGVRRAASPAWVGHLTLIVAGSLLVAALAQLVIPIGVIPITGQTLGVLLVGAWLGGKRGAAAMALYLAEGAAGLPFFAGGAASAAVLVGPTAGYLWAFIPAAFVVGWLAERGWDKRVSTTLAAMTLGTLIIFVGGAAWLAAMIAGGTIEPTSGSTILASVLAMGVLPFVPGAVIKMLIAANVLPIGWEAMRALEGKRHD